MWGQGIARYTDEQKMALMKEDLDALSTLLGTKSHFITEGEIHELDIVVYTWLACILFISIDSPFRRLIQSYKNLVDFAKRLETETQAKKND